MLACILHVGPCLLFQNLNLGQDTRASFGRARDVSRAAELGTLLHVARPRLLTCTYVHV